MRKFRLYRVLGHKCTTLEQVNDPDDVKEIKVDRRTLPNGHYTDAGYEKRGCEAMYDRGILPQFAGVLCYDHWKPYDRYDACLHALCNAHHIFEGKLPDFAASGPSQKF